MFLGEYEHTIDPKGRLAIPARFREPFLSGLVLTRGIDPCLIAYPLAEWRQLAEKLVALPYTQDNVRRISRNTFANAVDLELDKQGRILIPLTLREVAQIHDSAVIVGLYHHLEIWSKELWDQERAVIREQAWQLAESIEVLR